MRLKRLWIEEYKNLRNFDISFTPEESPYTVLVGHNGTGKSNLFEVLASIFVALEWKRHTPFRYRLEYLCRGYLVEVECNPQKKRSRTTIYVSRQDETFSKTKIGLNQFEKFEIENGTRLLPSHIFGYYSGSCLRFEQPFSEYKKWFSKEVKKLEAGEILPRRMLFADLDQTDILVVALWGLELEDPDSSSVLRSLEIAGIENLRLTVRPPSTYNEQKDLPATMGLTGLLLDLISGFNNFSDGDPIPSGPQAYAAKTYKLSTRAILELSKMARNRETNLFSLLFEAREQRILSGVSFDVVLSGKQTIRHGALSEGQKQLLLVLGMIKFSQHEEAIFLLDEPDTHLNPFWQYSYLELIREWTKGATDVSDCHVLLTTHNPLTISALEQNEVRIMCKNELGDVVAYPPYNGPQGLGFTGTLIEVFGLATSLDSKTQKIVDERNNLARIEKRNSEEGIRLSELNRQLKKFGFMFEDREPEYQEFLRARQAIHYSNEVPFSPLEIGERQKSTEALLRAVFKKTGGKS